MTIPHIATFDPGTSYSYCTYNMFIYKFHRSKEGLFQLCSRYIRIYVYICICIYICTRYRSITFFLESDTFSLQLTITGNGDDPIKRPKINEMSSFGQTALFFRGSTYVYIPGTQMTLVLIGKDLVLGG